MRAGSDIMVVTSGGAILAGADMDWRANAASATYFGELPEHLIRLHAELAITCYLCPVSGVQIGVDVHRRTVRPPSDVRLAL
jgi:hypothetical protein